MAKDADGKPVKDRLCKTEQGVSPTLKEGEFCW